MDIKFVRDRIAKLCLEKKVSEREVSLSLDKNHSYINTITSGKITPTIESLFEICNYFEITPFEFFHPSIDDPITSSKIYNEIKRLSNNDLSNFLLILETMKPSDYSSFLSFMDRYKWNKAHKS